MQSNLAPIGISTYSRINHLKKTIEALQNNKLAIESELYIFSDAPKAGDEVIVNEVRNYIHTITGFKKIHIIERNTNGRVNNNRGGIQYLLDTYGKCIFMEDDIVTAKAFLTFVNEALETYKENYEILSITGYTPPIEIPDGDQKDFFVLRRFNGWGAGFWKNKYEMIEQKLDKDTVEKRLEDREFLKKLSSNGVDIPAMVRDEISGRIDALDVKIMYQQALNNWYTVYPKKSLVQNIGHDGSGVHCIPSDRFHHNELWDKTDSFVFDKDIKPNQNIVKINFDFRFSMNSFAKELIVINLLEKIEKLEGDSFSIFGVGELTRLLIAKLQSDNTGKKIRYLIDLKEAEREVLFHGYEVVSPETALENGEITFVLASWNARKILTKKLLELSPGNKPLNILSPEII